MTPFTPYHEEPPDPLAIRMEDEKVDWPSRLAVVKLGGGTWFVVFEGRFAQVQGHGQRLPMRYKKFAFCTRQCRTDGGFTGKVYARLITEVADL